MLRPEGGRASGGNSPASGALSHSVSAQHALQPLHEAGFVFPGEGVFLDAQDAPAALAQGAADQAVASVVAAELFAPEGAVALRQPAMERAAMPETAVHEDGDFGGAENEIRFAKQRLSAPPAVEAVGAKDFGQREFRVPVAVGTDAGHHLGAFGFGEDVGHGQTATICGRVQ